MTPLCHVPQVGLRSVPENANGDLPSAPNLEFLLNESLRALGHESERVTAEICAFSAYTRNIE